ncbi:copper homeostasis membrane protein CopD [uncultured Brevundimonas sp.]|uniref:copper homeostasis membrane protein CopD n=1 Tax=uncultured Brevundimonas sp. TaxID=213418 RepID=UPI0030EE8CDD|tara:strand:+ start:1027 stop:1941 length:915 start_codon:yes stop_codon:yes gene_type:complete
MLEIAVIGLRWLEYSGAVVLFGVPFFLLHSFRDWDAPNLTWARPTLIVASIVVAVGSLVALVAQTAVMAGSLTEALKPASLSFMVTGTTLGLAMVIRVAVALTALFALAVFGQGRSLWRVTAVTGLVIVASFAWTGHGAATAGPGGLIHLGADVIHAVAAALWLGALAALLALLLRRVGPEDPAIHRALHGFAGLGTVAVVLLTASGLVNSWFLVGPTRIVELGTSLYGQLLIAKLALFVLMLALASANRFHLTPALGTVIAGGDDSRSELQRLKNSVLVETTVGLILLGLVAVMGTLAPPAAM